MAAATSVSSLSIENVMAEFSKAFYNAIDVLSVEARILLGILITIDLLWSVLSNLDEQDHLKNLIMRCIKYGFFYWIVANYRTLLAQVINGFIQAGLYAGPSSESIILGYLSHPEQLFIFGLGVIKDNINHINKLQSTLGTALSPMLSSSILWHDIIALMIMGGFLMMTMQIFLTMLEFYILGGIALIIIPFGAFQRTAHIAEKVFTLVICFGVKLMVIVFLLSVIHPLFGKFSPDPNAELDVYTALLEFAGCMSLTFLMWHAPNMASGLMSGAMSMNAASSVGQARGMAMGMGMGMGMGGQGNSLPMKGSQDNTSAMKQATNVSSTGSSGVSSVQSATDTGNVGAITKTLSNLGTTLGKHSGNSSNTGSQGTAATNASPAPSQGSVPAVPQGSVPGGGGSTGGATNISDQKAPTSRLAQPTSGSNEAAATTEKK